MKDMGVNIMIMPMLTATAAARAMVKALDYYKETEYQPGEDQLMSMREFNTILRHNLQYK